MDFFAQPGYQDPGEDSAVLAMAVNVIMSLLPWCMPLASTPGLALATSIAATVNAGLPVCIC